MRSARSSSGAKRRVAVAAIMSLLWGCNDGEVEPTTGEPPPPMTHDESPVPAAGEGAAGDDAAPDEMNATGGMPAEQGGTSGEDPVVAGSDGDRDDDAGLDESSPPLRVPFTPLDPIESAAMTWTYVPFPTSKCRDGSSTGIGINVNPSSDKLLIFLDQGGACFNLTTCLVNPSRWSEVDLHDPAQLLSAKLGVLSRSDPANPFADWNLVYVPYCSGDGHMGSSPSGYLDQPQQGYTNFGEYLARVVPTFPSLSMVVLSGSSAGGFGAAWNWMRTQDAFGAIPVHVLDDSGPPVGGEYAPPCLQRKMIELWGLDKSVHPACRDCDPITGDLIAPMLSTAMTRLGATRRFAIVSNDEDATLKATLGYGLNECQNIDDLLPPVLADGEYPIALEQIRTTLAPYPTFAMYLVKGTDHVLLFDPGKFSAAGVKLSDWLDAFIAGTPGFANVGP